MYRGTCPCGTWPLLLAREPDALSLGFFLCDKTDQIDGVRVAADNNDFSVYDNYQIDYIDWLRKETTQYKVSIMILARSMFLTDVIMTVSTPSRNHRVYILIK